MILGNQLGSLYTPKTCFDCIVVTLGRVCGNRAIIRVICFLLDFYIQSNKIICTSLASLVKIHFTQELDGGLIPMFVNI